MPNLASVPPQVQGQVLFPKLVMTSVLDEFCKLLGVDRSGVEFLMAAAGGIGPLGYLYSPGNKVIVANEVTFPATLFRITIFPRRIDTPLRLLVAIAHEMVHVLQMLDGRYVRSDRGHKIWQGRHYKLDDYLYSYFPWEREAFDLSMTYVALFLDAADFSLVRRMQDHPRWADGMGAVHVWPVEREAYRREFGEGLPARRKGYVPPVRPELRAPLVGSRFFEVQHQVGPGLSMSNSGY